MRAQLTSAGSNTQAGETQIMSEVIDESSLSPIDTPLKAADLKKPQQQRLHTAGHQ